MNAPAAPSRWTQRRKRAPLWARVLSLPVMWIVGVPVTKALARRWPQTLARNITKFMGAFPVYEPQASDVFVCSYFKSGTNWTLQIATQIAHRGRADFEHIHDVVPWPDVPENMRHAVPLAHDGPRLGASTGLRVIKTHLPLEQPVPYSPRARYICVVRDPKDVFVSGYYFTRAIVAGAMMPSVRGWLDAFLSPDAPLGSWAAHLQSCWALRHRNNVLFLTYESMRADLPGTVDRIAALMGVALRPDERATVIGRSTFTYMKSVERKFEPAGAPWSSPRGAMLRRGEGGKSAELLTPAQQRRIDDYCRADLLGLGSDFPYDEAFNVTPPAAADVRGSSAAVDPDEPMRAR